MDYNNIFDSHSHYADPAFDADRFQLLDSLPSSGVRAVMLASSSIDDSHRNLEIAKAKAGFAFAACGIHPEEAANCPNGCPDELSDLAQSGEFNAIGEIGLDYHYGRDSRELQLILLEQQLALANDLKLPVILHSREATADMLDLLRKYRPIGVLHCFSGSRETALEALSLGLYIGFTGVITFSNAKKALSALDVVPMDRLLIETDCPYMAPEPLRGKRCDSSMLVHTAKKAAEIKGCTAQELINTTCENAARLYRINL